MDKYMDVRNAIYENMEYQRWCVSTMRAAVSNYIKDPDDMDWSECPHCKELMPSDDLVEHCLDLHQPDRTPDEIYLRTRK